MYRCKLGKLVEVNFYIYENIHDRVKYRMNEMKGLINKLTKIKVDVLVYLTQPVLVIFKFQLINAVTQSNLDILEKIKTDWNSWNWPFKEEVESAGRLDWSGRIPSLICMMLSDIDIRNMPCDVLAKLTSARVLTYGIDVARVTGDISPILSNRGCKPLQLSEITITEMSHPPEIKVDVVNLYDLNGDTTSLMTLSMVYLGFLVARRGMSLGS